MYICYNGNIFRSQTVENLFEGSNKNLILLKTQVSQVDSLFEGYGMSGLASAWAIARRR